MRRGWGGRGVGVAVLNFSRGLATMAEGIVTAGVQRRPVCFVMIDFLKSRKGLGFFLWRNRVIDGFQGCSQ